MRRFHSDISHCAAAPVESDLPGYLRDLADMLEISDRDIIDSLNQRIHRRTGIRRFFPDQGSLDRFLTDPDAFLAEPHAPCERQWGDFQTPDWLAAAICRLLAREGIAPSVVIEPTFGAGSLLDAAIETFPRARLFYGVEIQQKYEWRFKLRLAAASLNGCARARDIELHRDDIFEHRFNESIAGDDLLVIGNPPWVTNAELGALSSGNRPARRNLKSLHGLDALTGRSNFDLSECVILRMLELFDARRGWLAMLCKTSVARNIIEMLPGSGVACRRARAYAIDTAEAFGVAVDASLFVLWLGGGGKSDEGEIVGDARCGVARFAEPELTLRTFGWVGGKFVADSDLYGEHAFLDGASPCVWRQGIKHDCAAVMELRRDGEIWKNGDGDVVDIEREYLYPLLKSSDLRSFATSSARRGLIVTQRHIGEETARLREEAPGLWRYLESHRDQLDGRRSSIYRKAPPFALFGIGDYSFKPYKVGVAGLYKRPFFSLVLPIDGRPAMLDDTCYFLGFDALPHALFTASLLNHPIVLHFLDAIIFPNAKRPYTKSALMRIDLAEAASRVRYEALREIWERHGYAAGNDVTHEAYERYRSELNSG